MSVQYVQHRHVVHHESAEVISTNLCDDFATMHLSAPQIAAAARPGQFISVLCPRHDRPLEVFDSANDWAMRFRAQRASAPGLGPLLRRPISIHDAAADRICILFKLVGRGTHMLAGLKPGTRLDALGPMGNGFDLDGEFRTALLVGGGAGIAPLPFLARRLQQAGKTLVVVLGARRKPPVSPHLFSALGATVHVASEAPIQGAYHGLCTDLVESVLSTIHLEQPRAFACGPAPMLRRVASLCSTASVPLQVSLEQRMGCALGACMACVVQVFGPHGLSRPVRVCTEGPVFDSQKVDWNAT